MNQVLRVENVTKTYKTSKKTFITAVDDVSFHIDEGEIYGLLGPNGAGKSTIIKMITSLAKIDSGTIYIDGEDINNSKPTGKVGAIIEMPTMFSNMSAIDNLRYFATLQGGIDESKILSALDTVGLRDRCKDKAGTYSLGMKQRLAIAQAIMSSPRLLILDEPTNGLDPSWILSIRELIKKLAREYKVAVLVSSHILSEMQSLCDRVGIINKGKLVKEATLEEISGFRENDRIPTVVNFTTNNPEMVQNYLSQYFRKVWTEGYSTYVHMTPDNVPIVNHNLVCMGVGVYSIEIKKRTLEDVFTTLVDNVGNIPTDNMSKEDTVKDDIKTSNEDNLSRETINGSEDKVDSDGVAPISDEMGGDDIVR